eukprot:TRINITY_DN12145_c0_g1_i1.p1 TRINITY_DN12145_c0_g1~~TRINITY_DN12145_c0_g1_i1.p1  ORF type:complete len:153 (+),score=14.44 TRINITY_DN12145_c0_g1_i1:64-522(+)
MSPENEAQCCCCAARIWIIVISILRIILLSLYYGILIFGTLALLAVLEGGTIFIILGIIFAGLLVIAISGSVISLIASTCCRAPNPAGKILIIIYLVIAGFGLVSSVVGYIVLYLMNARTVLAFVLDMVFSVGVEILWAIPYFIYLGDWNNE